MEQAMLATLNADWTALGRRLARKKRWIKIPTLPITSVSPKLSDSIPIRMNRKFIDMVPDPAERVTFMPEARAEMQRKKR